MFLETVHPDALASALLRLPAGPERALALFVAAGSREAVPALLERLRGMGRAFFGGIFPGLLHDGAVHRTGLHLLSLPVACPPALMPGLDVARVRLPSSGACATHEADGDCTLVVLVDGLSAAVAPFVHELFQRYGGMVSYVGGGAGVPELTPDPCVFTQDGFAGDAAVVAFVPRRCSLGVRHGWEPILGPFVATRTRGNVIEELNWRPAVDVYHAAIVQDLGADPGREQLPSLLPAYPFGVQRAGTECVVRDPLQLAAGGGLVCAGEVAENAVLHVLRGRPRALVTAAGRAARESARRAGAAEVSRALVFDCMSREGFLGERYAEEIAAVSRRLRRGRGPLPALTGVLSVGEVASTGEGILEFLNKTTVVGLLHGTP